MTKTEIYNKIKAIIYKLNDTSLPSDHIMQALNGLGITNSSFMNMDFDKFNTEATPELNAILMDIMCNKDLAQKTEQIGYFFHLLLDCTFGDMSNESIKVFFNIYVGERLKNENFRNLLMNYRKPNDELLEFILNLPAPSLKELVHISYVEPQENWLDPFTKKVMDIPVKYMVDGKKYICDLNTLLNNSESACLILCPLTNKCLPLSHITPCYEIVKEIEDNCPNTYGERDIQEALNEALTYARDNQLDNLQIWHRKNPSVSLDKHFLAKNTENPKGDKWTIAHVASRVGNFEILCWLLEQQLSLFEIKNAANKTPLDLLTKRLEQLISDCEEQPDNHALQLLLIMYCKVMKCEEKSVMSLDELISGEKPYPNALFWQIKLVPSDDPDFIDKILPILKNALKLGAQWPLGMIAKIFTECHKGNDPAKKHKLYTIFPARQIISHLINMLQETPIIDRSLIECFYGMMLSSLNNTHKEYGIGYQAIQAIYYSSLGCKRERILNHNLNLTEHDMVIKILLESIIPKASQEANYLKKDQEKMTKTKNTPTM
jgi:hypothetical protein